MNYFSHYFYFRTQSSPYKTAGLILPDLARFSEGKSKLQLPPDKKETANDQFLALEEGCRIHYDTDKKFHASENFQRMVQEIEEAFHAHNFETGEIRRWFFTHLLSEMVMDRVLIKKYPLLLEEFYKQLEQTSPATVANYLSVCGRKGTDRFAQFFKRFYESKFLFSYQEDGGFLISLNRTMEKAAQPPAVGATAEALLEVLPEIEARLAPYESALQEMLA